MKQTTTRRAFVQSGAAAGVASALSGPPTAHAADPVNAASLKLGKGLRDLSEETIAFFLQMGVEHVVMPGRFTNERRSRGLVPATDQGPQNDDPITPLDADELLRIKQHLADRGLSAEMVRLPRSWRILHGKPGAEEDFGALKASIQAAGRAGIAVMEYNFTPLRGSEGYARTTGRGDCGLRDFDYARVKDLPPLPNVGEHSREQMWERLERFLKELIPVCEDSDVRLALHPNDPPIPVFRGAAQPVRSLDDLKELIDLIDSPANGITLDTGVTTEMGEDAAEAIRYFGSRDRINHVHYRNVRVETPYFKYLETMHDEGECDMLAAMRAFAEVGYSRLLIPDHAPEFSDDSPGSEISWAFALGYLRSLRHAAS